ncbi:MAG: cysteine--tRNA ligase [Elusimicrobia bacterium]|nr:cysteine--tRNA ligase [Elusimicrobiota bacterium]
MQLVLYNTLSRSQEVLKPLRPSEVGLYTCGPTVYNFLHVGNYRTYVFEDLLRRCLRYFGFSVRHVMNITDVGHLTSQADEGEDKVELAAAQQGKTAWEIAEFYTRTFLEDSKRLNLLAPDVLCRATGHIPEQIELIKRLEARGLTYAIADGVYFDTSRFPGYGRLAGAAHQEGLKAGARVEANLEKRSPNDFALWKFSSKDKKRQMEWESPWGRGFPGWHIECSAMAMKYLGESFDIHCGGVDHIPIHHTNEIAQAEGATGKPFVRCWMHAEFLLMGKEKMAKSFGGFIRLQDIEAKGFSALDYRYLCLTAHYRKQLEFSFDALEAARSALRRLRDRVRVILMESESVGTRPLPAAARERFRARLADDLDVPGALACIWDALRPGVLTPVESRAFLEEIDPVLGLDLIQTARPEAAPPNIERLIRQRDAARDRKDFPAADAIRRELEGRGIVLEDTQQGTRWKRRS